jgi:hypothetical protein
VPYLSAASGLVCADGRAYVIGDDELHLAVFDDAHAPGRLLRLVPGALPRKAKPRKRAKPDFECLLQLDAGHLLALGSGSSLRRERGVVVPLAPPHAPSSFDLAPLYRPLRDRWGEVNIEGALLRGDELWLLQRGVAGRVDNAIACFGLADLRALIEGDARDLAPRSVCTFALPSIDGVPLGFTDACALDDQTWLFSAAAEDRSDSIADGSTTGSALGCVGADGALRWLRRFAGRDKVEGIDARVQRGAIELCWVTDADDPARASTLWWARAALAG